MALYLSTYWCIVLLSLTLTGNAEEDYVLEGEVQVEDVTGLNVTLLSEVAARLDAMDKRNKCQPGGVIDMDPGETRLHRQIVRMLCYV